MSHYKPYPAYKDSGVKWLGRVPEHWYVVRMRYAATLNPPVRRDLLDDPDQEVSFLPMEAIGEDGSLNLEQNRPVADVRNGYSYFEDGDVAFAKVTPCFENGKGALMRGLQCAAGFGTTELTVLRPNPAVADARYINYIVQCSSFRASGAGAMTGAGGLKRVPDEFTRNFPVSLPELGEQRVIASNLDRETARIDALIEKKTRFIELLREKRQALITHAVTKGLDPNVKVKDSGVEWLGEVPEHWEVKRLRHALRVLTDYTSNGSFASLAENVEYLSEGYSRLVRLTDLRENLENDGLYVDQSAHEFLRNSELFGGEVLLANVGAYAGLVCLMPSIGGKATLGPNMMLLRFREQLISNDFAFTALGSLYAQEQLRILAVSAAQPKLNKDDVRSCVLAVPPLDEQREILAFVSFEAGRIDRLLQTTERSIGLLKERRSALTTAAVTGQIDLREAL